MFTLARYSVITFVAAAVTFCLFFIMQLLIATSDEIVFEESEPFILDIWRDRTEPKVIPELPELEKPVKPDDIPEMPKINFGPVRPGSVIHDIPEIKPEGGSPINLNLVDGNHLALTTIAPVYPERAKRRGIEGYVILQFTIAKNGSVIDPIVVESAPSGVFDKAAVNAVLKFKYKPKVENGMALEVYGVQNKFTFELDK
ncbi:MAG: TonB family protein [Pseudomonadota bacterium]